MKYKSRVDLYNWISLIFFVAVLALPNFVFDFSLIYFGIMVAFDLLVVIQTLTTSYSFHDEEVIVRSGLFKFGIYYERIFAIKKVKSCFDGSYSTALNSIEILFGEKSAKKPLRVYISPAKEEEFLREILAKCRGVERIEDKRK